jgi:hypothetical protein
MNTVRVVLPLMLISIVMLGCGDGRVKLPTAPVAGTVTYQGKPLTAGWIAFVHPSGQGAGADIAADGTFKLAAFQGKNQVAISCYAPEPSNPDPHARPMVQQAKSLIPRRYTNYSTSGLTLEVKPGQDNRADFTLTD